MVEREEPSLELSLVSSIAEPQLVELAADLGEVGFDQLLKDGVFRDIPVFGTLAGLVRIGGVVRDYVFARKVRRFLVGLSAISLYDREQFVEQIGSRAERKRLGDTLVLLLDRLDDMEKPEALAKLFAAYVRGRFDFATFRQLSTALERVPLSSLPELQKLYRPGAAEFVLGGEHLGQFVVAGLVDIRFTPTGPTGGPGGSYVKNSLGELFLEILSNT